eukprot:Gb_03979 [translate_table: standard]
MGHQTIREKAQGGLGQRKMPRPNRRGDRGPNEDQGDVGDAQGNYNREQWRRQRGPREGMASHREAGRQGEEGPDHGATRRASYGTTRERKKTRLGHLTRVARDAAVEAVAVCTGHGGEKGEQIGCGSTRQTTGRLKEDDGDRGTQRTREKRGKHWGKTHKTCESSWGKIAETEVGQECMMDWHALHSFDVPHWIQQNYDSDNLFLRSGCKFLSPPLPEYSLEGISLTIDQWESFKKAVPAIEEAIEQLQ